MADNNQQRGKLFITAALGLFALSGGVIGNQVGGPAGWISDTFGFGAGSFIQVAAILLGSGAGTVAYLQLLKKCQLWPMNHVAEDGTSRRWIPSLSRASQQEQLNAVDEHMEALAKVLNEVRDTMQPERFAQVCQEVASITGNPLNMPMFAMRQLGVIPDNDKKNEDTAPRKVWFSRS